MTYSHEPDNYVCPFCLVVAGTGDVLTKPGDVVLRNQWVTAFISSHWWPNNPGHVIVIPNQHYENIYALPAEVAAHIHEAARQIALAFKATYHCDGTSTRQHNEPAGYQEVWHYHLHVFPRYENDFLYDLTHQRFLSTPEERLPYAQKLRAYLAQTAG